MEQTVVKLLIGGKEYRAWQLVSISSKLLSYARVFRVGFTRESAGTGIGIKIGDLVRVKIDDDPGFDRIRNQDKFLVFRKRYRTVHRRGE